MTVESIRKALHKGKPFAVKTASGEVYEVPHPDFAALSKTGRLITIWLDDAEQITLDVALLLGIVTKEPMVANE